MKTSLKVIAFMAAIAVLVSVQSAVAQAKKVMTSKVEAQVKGVTQGTLQGAWKVTEFSTSISSASKITTTAQPGIFIFTKKHYSIMFLSIDKPRSEVPLKNPTDAQKVAAWEPLSANSGSYEITGTTLTTHPMIAKNPAVMKPGAFVTYDFKIQRNTLLLTPKESNTAPGSNPPTFKFLRLE
jgi:hypothetical protein